MASKQSEQLVTYYKSVIGALAVNPEMPLDEMRAMFEHMGDVTGSRAGLIISKPMPAGSALGRCRRAAQDRVLLLAWRRAITGSMFTHRGMDTPRRSTVALIVNYGLAPEGARIGSGQRYGKGVNGCWIRDQAGRIARLAIGGRGLAVRRFCGSGNRGCRCRRRRCRSHLGSTWRGPAPASKPTRSVMSL